MTIILIFGLTCAGKSTFCKYAQEEYGMFILHLRRLFENKVGGKKNTQRSFLKLKEIYGCATGWLDYLKKDIEQLLAGGKNTIIEGLYTQEEASWFENVFNARFFTVYIDAPFEARIPRYCTRYALDETDARRMLQESDNNRRSFGVQEMKGKVDFVLNNEMDEEHYYQKINNLHSQIEIFPGLLQIRHFLHKETKFRLSIEELVYFIRHISIADGCRNSCSHCFSNSSSQIRQTKIKGFKLIMKEMGEILVRTNRPLRFFHLGASTDPAMVKDYATYLSCWVHSFPSFQTIKIFTHGWDLRQNNQKEELERVLSIVRNSPDRDIRFVLSFDAFSYLARTDWKLYLTNILANLIFISSEVGRNRIRIEVFYTPDRNRCDEVCTLDYWRKSVQNGSTQSFHEMISEIQSHDSSCDKICGKVTIGILQVFIDAGLHPTDLIEMTRDCDTIFAAGRGKQFFTDNKNDIHKGYEVQKEKVLYSLKDYELQYDGIIVYPNGSCRLVNYLGFQLGSWLNEGLPIIDYMSII